jgi:hypothetical protein
MGSGSIQSSLMRLAYGIGWLPVQWIASTQSTYQSVFSVRNAASATVWTKSLTV